MWISQTLQEQGIRCKLLLNNIHKKLAIELKVVHVFRYASINVRVIPLRINDGILTLSLMSWKLENTGHIHTHSQSSNADNFVQPTKYFNLLTKNIRSWSWFKVWPVTRLANSVKNFKEWPLKIKIKLPLIKSRKHFVAECLLKT